MALTALSLAQVAAGWTDSDFATGSSTEVATSSCPVSGAGFAQSPSLVLSQFQLDAFGVAAITSLFIRVCAKSDASNPVLNVYLARNGVKNGSIKTIALTTTLQEMTLGGDLWGAVITDADCFNLQVVCYVTALDTGTHSISYCSARATVPDGDAIPTSFTLTPQTGVALATVVTSNAVTVAGTGIASCVSVDNGEWEKNVSGTWSKVDGSVVAGNTVKVRHTSAATAGTLKASVLTIGSVSASFNSTSTAADTTPDVYLFPAGLIVNEIPLASYAQSGQVPILGINAPAVVSITGGKYAINGGAFTTVAGTISFNDKLEVACLASTSFGATTSCTVNVGGVTQSFSVVSVRKYGTFTPFVFAAQTGVPISSVRTSNQVLIQTWNEVVDVTVSGGTIQVGGVSGFGAGPVTLYYEPQYIEVRHTSSASLSTVVTTIVTATGQSSGVSYIAMFSSATLGAVLTPTAFPFTALGNVGRTQTFTSNTVTISAIVGNVPVVATNGGLVSIAGGAYVASGTITAGQTLTARVTSSAQPGYTTTTNVTVGTVTQAFSVTTDYVINADF